MILDEEPACTTHDEELAGWRCEAPACRKYLCGKCAAKSLNTFYCGVCGATASQLVVARNARGFATWVAKAILYPVSSGVLPLAVVSLLLAIIGFGASKLEPRPGAWDVLSGALRGAVVVVYALVTADAAARGNVAERGGLLRLVRGLLATLVVWAPAALYLWWLGIPAKGLAADRLLWLYAGLALVYLPIAVSTSVTDASYGDVANPFKLFELAWQLGRRYWITMFATAVLAVMTYGIAGSTIPKLRVAVTAPIAGDLAAWLPTLALVGAVAYLVGLLPFVWGDRFGWGDASMYADPLHPKLVAEAKRKNAPALELDSQQAVAAATALAERNDARKLADAVKEDNMLRALKLYEARSWSPTAIDERQLLVLGKAATRAKKHDVAKKILEETVARKGRVESHAMVALAQLHAQMGEAARAEELYKQIVMQFPNSEASKMAALKLKG